MNIQDRMEISLRSPQPGQAFRDLVSELAKEGYPKQRILQYLEDFLTHVRERKNHQEFEENVILDTMDCLEGWCHPQAKLLPD